MRERLISVLLVAAVLIILLALIGALALIAWLQITRDVIAEEADEEQECDGGGGPGLSTDLERAL